MLISDEDMRALARVEGVREVALVDCILGYDDTEPFVSYLKRVKANIGQPNGKPHWFSVVKSGTENDPALFNLTAQGKHIREHGEVATRALLSDHGLKLGQVLAPTDDADAIKGSTNPYSDQCKLSPDEKEKRIASLIQQGGSRLASQLAKAAGKTITNQRLQAVGAARR